MTTRRIAPSPAVLDFEVDWTDELSEDCDSITDSDWVVTGLTVNSVSNCSTKAKIWLTGATLNQVYEVTNTITTALGRTQSKFFFIKCER